MRASLRLLGERFQHDAVLENIFQNLELLRRRDHIAHKSECQHFDLSTAAFGAPDFLLANTQG